MLDYAPDVLTGSIAATRGQEMSVVWGESLPVNGVLLQLIAAARAAAPGTGGRSGHGAFQPERMSGFCASS